MLNETARVVAVNDDGLWLETRRKSACQGCSAKGTCGHSLLDSMHPGRRSLIKLAAGGPAFEAGAEVRVSVPDALVLKLSLLFYLMPLAALLSGGLLAARLGGGDGAAAFGALAGLAGGALAVRVLGRRLEARPDFRPRILEQAPAQADHPTSRQTEF